jgi:hypothetical protein
LPHFGGEIRVGRCGADMHIPIPIPIGVRHIAVVKGTVWKFVRCEQCNQPYAYQLELQATGEDLDLLFLDRTASTERAREQAEQNLTKKSHNCVLPVPCPDCGFYQAEMATLLKDEASMNALQIAGTVISVLAFFPLTFGMPFAAILTVILATAGLSLLGYGYVVEFRFDPNAGDSEARKENGRTHAVWGESLIALLATTPNAESTGAHEPAVRLESNG